MEKRERHDYTLPAHLLGGFPGRERRRGQQPVEKFIDPIGAEWIVDKHRQPFGDDDFYRILRRTDEQGQPMEMRITESWMAQLNKAREIHERKKGLDKGTSKEL